MTIKELRKSVNMTQQQFAKWLSTSIENIKNWESGKSQPSEMLLKLISYYVEGNKQGEQAKIEIENSKKTHYLLYTEIYSGPYPEKIYKSKEEAEKDLPVYKGYDPKIIEIYL